MSKLKGLGVRSYLGLSVKWTDAGTTIYVPDADVTVTGAASRCQDIMLPRTPGQSLEEWKKHDSFNLTNSMAWDEWKQYLS